MRELVGNTEDGSGILKLFCIGFNCVRSMDTRTSQCDTMQGPVGDEMTSDSVIASHLSTSATGQLLHISAGQVLPARYLIVRAKAQNHELCTVDRDSKSPVM